MKIDREFQFRGDRNYLHSAAVFDDLLKLRGADATKIDLKFHRRTVQQVIYTDDPEATGRAVAEWSDSGGKLYIVEREDGISNRVVYDEPSLARMLEIDGRIVRIPAETPGFTRIEALVAGFKLLLQTVHAGVERKYVFVRIRLDRCPEGAMEIRYSRGIGVFFQGDIAETGKGIVGQIFFGTW